MPIYFLNESNLICVTINISDDNLTEGLEQFLGELTVTYISNQTQSFNTSIIIDILDDDGVFTSMTSL